MTVGALADLMLARRPLETRRTLEGEALLCVLFPECRWRAAWIIRGTSFCPTHAREAARSDA